MPERAHRPLRDILAMNRTVGIVLVTVLFFGLGEQLWSPLLPADLRARTKEEAAIWLVGWYACLRNFFEAFCYIGGGQLTARLGDRGSLLLFGGLTIAGYVLFLSTTHPWVIIVAALLIMGWEPLSVPVTFTTVGSTVATSQRGMAFALQSIQKRLPKILGPFIAGLTLGLAEWHFVDPATAQTVSMRSLVWLALGLGLVSVLIQIRWMPHHKPVPNDVPATAILRDLHPTLKRLLIAEIFTRWCDWMVREFVVLYVILERGASLQTAAFLFSIQNLTALLTYLPIGRMTQVVGVQPFIGLTFLFFASFPLALATLPGTWGLILAFMIYGLREVGEPARKALITSLLPEAVRARGVGLYWGLRSFALCPAALVGAATWSGVGRTALLYCAFGVGCIGAAVFYLFCNKPDMDKARA